MQAEMGELPSRAWLREEFPSTLCLLHTLQTRTSLLLRRDMLADFELSSSGSSYRRTNRLCVRLVADNILPFYKMLTAVAEMVYTPVAAVCSGFMNER